MTLRQHIFCLIFILVLLVSSIGVFSQTGITVKGKVLDNTSKPIEFATVLLLSHEDTLKPLRTAITDSIGFFSVNAPTPGEYVLRIQMTSFETLQRAIELNNFSNNYDAGNLILIVTPTQLETISVTAQKSVIQRTSQGLIVNAAANLTKAGGTVTDILRNTPTVLVDAEGNITIRGKPPLIMLNGRNSSISGTDQIPASSVESIEIINNPSAQYDAEAEAGIINIILKKNNQIGTNGAVALGVGYGAKGRISSSAFINHKTPKWNYALAYDNRFAGRTRKVNGDRTNYDSEDERYLMQRRNDDRVERLQNLKLNIDFNPDKQNVWGFEAIGNLNGEDNDESLTNTIYTASNSFNYKYNRHSIEIRKTKIGELALSYSRKYNDSRKSLSASINTSFNDSRENTDIVSQSLTEDNGAFGDPFLQRTHNYQNTNVTNLKADYAFPISARSLIETGYKATLRFMDADFQWLDKENGSYVPNPAASNIFSFNEQIHAVYLLYSSYAGEKGNPRWKYDFGLRAELSWNNGDAKNSGEKFSNDYVKLFPTANIVHYRNSKEFWKLSYSRRINRPTFGQLNPFTDITDSLNQRSGNPNLKPELVHSLELGYNKDWHKLSCNAVLFYRNASDAIRPYTVLRPDGVAFTMPMNFGHAISYGIENIFSARPFQKYDFNLSLSFFQQDIKGTIDSNSVANSLFSWYGKLINNFALWQGSRLQITGLYNAPTATPQGERIAIYNVDVGFQQKLGKGNGRIGLTVTDIFNTQKNGFVTNGENFTFTRTSKVDSRAVFVTFAYTFGTSFKETLLENQFSND